LAGLLFLGTILKKLSVRGRRSVVIVNRIPTIRSIPT
jgi:hypothetical protein